MTITDRLHRPLGAVRVSVTDRCNLRCQYCMPEDEYTWLPRESLLSFEEIARLTRVFRWLGARKIRLTGGEPLLRKDLDRLVAMIKRGERGERGLELALTTNGLLLAQNAHALRAAGLDRVTVSLDTLRPERMQAFARSAHHADVLRGIDAARDAGFPGIKLNTVVVRGYNDDEINAIAEFAQARGIEPRYIEYMDVGGATQWNRESVVSGAEIIASLSQAHGQAEAMTRGDDPHAPAERFRFADGLVAGVITSTTAPFCRDCDRLRLTADGVMFLCLYAESGVNLRDPLRQGATDAEMQSIVRAAWSARADRGAEARAALGVRGVLVPLEGLRADPRREMHVRGG